MNITASHWGGDDQVVKDKVSQRHKDGKAAIQTAGALARQPHLETATSMAEKSSKEISERSSTEQ
eukprot:994219-Pyramimonas_sp.AAC.1